MCLFLMLLCWYVLRLFLLVMRFLLCFVGATPPNSWPFPSKKTSIVQCPRDFSDLWRAAISGAPVAHAECGVQSRSGILWTSLRSLACPDLYSLLERAWIFTMICGHGSEWGCPIWWPNLWFLGLEFWPRPYWQYFHDLWQEPGETFAKCVFA